MGSTDGFYSLTGGSRLGSRVLARGVFNPQAIGLFFAETPPRVRGFLVPSGWL